MWIINQFDNSILDFINNNMHSTILDNIMVVITKMGNAGILWILIGVALLLSNKTRKYGFIMLIALTLCLIVGNLAIKPMVARLRPCDVNSSISLLISRPTDFSFPSGHTMSSFAGAVVLFYMDRKIGFISLILASLIGFSRLYLYVHYPTDVIMGMLIGIVIAILSIKIYKKIENRINVL